MYTCQVSRLRCESHAYGLKTLISCQLTLSQAWLKSVRYYRLNSVFQKTFKVSESTKNFEGVNRCGSLQILSLPFRFSGKEGSFTANHVVPTTVNSLYCLHPWDRELVFSIARVRNSGTLFPSNICNLFCQGFSQAVCIIGVSVIVRCLPSESGMYWIQTSNQTWS